MIPFTQVMFRGVDYVVDVANVTGDLRKERVVLVSTKLTLHHKMEHGGVPRVREGTRWIVLDVPTTHPSGRTTGKKKSPVHQVFTKRVDGKERTCRVQYKSGAKTSTRHSWCELDDRLIAHFARRHGLGIITNDRRLARDAHLSLPKAHRDLLKHTRVFTLTLRGDTWVG